MKEFSVSTADGALVMAFGIMINGAARQVPFLRNHAGTVMILLLLVLLISVLTGYIRDALTGSFYHKHLQDPIVSFATGTWVAGLSVTTAAISKELSEFRPLAAVLYSAAILLWIGYLALILQNYLQIFRQPQLVCKVDGVLLLACVGTQSIVVAGSSLLGPFFPLRIGTLLIVAGLGFYCLGMSLIVIRYYKGAMNDLADDWKNTNCVIHGALSITGLASIGIASIPSDFAAGVWLLVLALFLVVEVLELLRGIQRIRKYGWEKGVFVYSPTQWSRNFTYGMLVAFSIKLPLAKSFLAGKTFFTVVQHLVIRGGTIVVLGLFLFEVGLLLKDFWELGVDEKGIQ